MLEKIINWSLHNRFFVILACVFAVLWGLYALQQMPLDAIPDLSAFAN